MHFYFFAVISLLAVFGNPMVVLAAALTVTLHHLVLWAVLPSSVFNYDAAIWVVFVHAAFVVLSTSGAVFIGRSFFDNVVRLDEQVQARTAALAERNARVRHLLDNVPQAILMVDGEGRLGGEWSARAAEWLGAPTAGEPLWALLGRRAPADAVQLELGWECLRDGFLPRALCLAQLPQRVELDGRTLALRYVPLDGEEDGPVDAVLVMLEDVTAQVAQERAESTQRELMALVQRILQDKHGFVEFAHEAEELITQIIEADALSPLLARRLHTLKGNAGIYGLDSVAETCHALEQEIADEGTLPSVEARAALRQRWDALRAATDALIGEQETAEIVVGAREHRDVVRALLTGAERAVIADVVAKWSLEPGRRRLARLAAQAERLALRLGKDVVVHVEDQGVRCDGEALRGVWSAAIHAVRNALDHGVEPAADRLAQGKPATARLTVRLDEDNDQVSFSISDDGRGVDWARVAAKAAARGLPHATPADLRDALFADGLSTADAVTDVSGRGVGMSAIRAEVEALGGVIEVDSVRGQGTTLRLCFPKDRVAAVALAA